MSALLACALVPAVAVYAASLVSMLRAIRWATEQPA